MSTTSNPAIRNLVSYSAVAQWDARAGSSPRATDRRDAAVPGTRPVTVEDIVNKTLLTLSTIVLTGSLTTFLGLRALFWPALPVALGIALYLVFRPRPSAALTLGYAVAEGIVLGAFTSTVDQDHPGAALQAVLGTCGVFVAMLVVYRTHALRLTTKRVKWIAAAILGVVLLVVANLIVALGLGYDLGLNDGGVVGVVFSLVCICLASLSFLLSFEAADRLVARGASADWAWYAAFGLCLNLVWLYIELLWARTFFR